MSIQSVNRIAEVSFKNHFLGTGEEKPVSGKIQVNHNTFDVTFANGRVRAKFASGNAFSNMFRSRTLSRFTERLQTQYDVWLDQQRQIEEAKAAEFALTLGFEDNPNTGKVKALVDEFKAFLEETNLAELFRFRLKLLAQQIDPRHANEVLARMLKDPGLSDNGEGGLDVDASKIGDKIIILALKETTGIQGLALLDKIDRETYDALVAFKSGPARETCLDKLFF